MLGLSDGCDIEVAVTSQAKQQEEMDEKAKETATMTAGSKKMTSSLGVATASVRPNEML